MTENGGPSRVPPNGLSSDRWLGGKLTLLQPLIGHRVGSDAALLAAAFDFGGGHTVDVGAGVGAVGLAIARRSEQATADLVEFDPALASLAGGNAAHNGLSERVRVLTLDVLDPAERSTAGLAADAADAVVTNPPHFESGTVRASPEPTRMRAHVLSGAGRTLGAWLRACLALLSPGGRFVMIHRPEAVAVILAAVENRLGGVALLPVYPKRGQAAHRLLVSGVKGSRAPARVAPGLILHASDGALTAKGKAIHRGDAFLDWGAGA